MPKTSHKNHEDMSYVDAHIHLADPGYNGQLENVMEDAERNDVAQLLSNATDYQTSVQTIELAKRHPDRILAAIGVHPFTVTQSQTINLEKFTELIERERSWVAAIGEIGLDGKYASAGDTILRQRETFRFFLNLAAERQIPAVVHSRKAAEETLTTLVDFNIPEVLLHWYDGPADTIHMINKRRYFISIGPAILYSRRITEIARAIDLELILTETDGPVRYHTLQGDQLTKPSLVTRVVDKIAEIRNLERETVRSAIVTNFQKFIQKSQGAQ